MKLDRRDVVRAAGLGLAALGIPRLFAACREQAPEESAVATTPLLVLRVEDDAARDADLGHLVGTFLANGTDEHVAVLTGLELRCATAREIGELAPDLAREPDVRALLVVLREAARRAVVGTPPALDRVPDESERGDRRYDASVRARHAWLASQLDEALRDSLERRADEERAAVGAAALDETDRVASAQRWPWQARAHAERAGEKRRAWLVALGIVARRRWESRAPEGSAWATSTGCGVRYATRTADPRVAALCGMGHVPEIGRRFLHFWTAEERNA